LVDVKYNNDHITHPFSIFGVINKEQSEATKAYNSKKYAHADLSQRSNMCHTFAVVIGVPMGVASNFMRVEMIDGKTPSDNTNTIIAECQVRDVKDFAVGHILPIKCISNIIYVVIR